ncbi:glycosyltransferase [Marinobacter sp. bablab_jr008]|uniref:glycosyltransferase n=1 Tax=Marinobacter sp. bablab_jr008 TaxID=2755064 RepID=UPI0018F12F6B|nr:glycosyltransferase [Marinobacter sp. bablab_jr008]
MKKEAIFISWESHTRSKSLSDAIGIPLFEIVVVGNRFKRYFFSMIKTALLIRRINPSVVIVQNPSIVLAFVSILLSLGKRKVVMDAHNAAIYPLEGQCKILNRFAWWLLRKSFLVIVTNNDLYREVERLHAKPFLLPDPIPSPPVMPNTFCKINDKPLQVVLVCTWAPDEPYQSFIEAARLLCDSGFEMKITGRPPDHISKGGLPKNVNLTGFISKAEYWDLLISSFIIVDLTTRDNCLVCGAYEAAAVGVPCILSNSDVARKVFKKGYVFVDNNPMAIADGILSVKKNHLELRDDIVKFSASHAAYIRQVIDFLKTDLEI